MKKSQTAVVALLCTTGSSNFESGAMGRAWDVDPQRDMRIGWSRLSRHAERWPRATARKAAATLLGCTIDETL